MIQLTQQGNVHILTIDAPEGNAFDEKLVAALHESLDAVEAAADGPGALVITGSGKAFSVGLNVPALMQYEPDQLQNFGKEHKRFYGRLVNFQMPTVAAINGHAFAAGAFLALCCDYRIMRDDKGWFCLSEVDVGVPIETEVMELAKIKLSPSVFRDVVLTGKRYTGPESLDANIVDRVCSEEELLPAAVELMAGLAEKQRGIFKTLKSNMYAPCAIGLGSSE